ncbi:hypothetical protein RirG_241570 [Rhizophagus irregularis DAOM 197198w]|uniref:HAT C-terminal dimerisation domain-containing protein n=2 Tax=Rhizophagus irregularis TaxID=588596 RepID=A0A015I940_RHIIW|nr:hypothetical protein RirG_241570 [Rhizophagus irregularis DAOM 197198w]
MENFDYYPGEDFDFDPILELQNQASGSSDTPHETFCSPATTRKPPGTQTTLSFSTNSTKNKGKADRDKNIYKRKKPSFTQEYFEKSINDKGDEIRICKILDESGKRCGQEYKNVGSSTGNLIAHLRDKHEIVAQDDTAVSKKPRNSKITSFARNCRPHSKHIQKKREEVTLKWMLLTNQPLSAVTNEAYREKMAEFDPSFVVPGEQKIKTMIVKSYNYNRQNLQNLLTETAESVSLTMDLWSSRAKHGYLGVTATWITPDFEIKDVMLENKYVPSPHSSDVITNKLYRCIKDWNLEQRVTSITTDNGSNMVAMFRLLNQKSGCEDVKRLSCTAHTIQLAIGKGLAPAEILVARARRLIHFFQYQKQVERLEQVQKKLDYVDIMRCIQDVSTRWNSTYYAWDRLFFLKDAIIQLQADLCTSTDRESKKDGNKLKRILLSDEEWSLLDQLIDILMPFEEATREFSGNTYVTLSQTIPTIKAKIFDLASEVPQNVGEFLDEDTVFDSEIVETRPIDFDDDEVISNITKENISIKNSLDTTGVLEKVKQNIYNALIYYWNIPNDLGLMAGLLDPYYKNLDFIEIDTEKERIIQKLRDEIGEVVVPESETLNNPAPSIDIESSIRSHKEYRQRRQSKTKKAIPNMVICDEVTNYLSLPLALETENPLDWWRIRSQNFPKLAKLARKYLAIPATSVSSERLFSDAGNLISAKRTSLDTKLAGQMLFLKRNIKTMKVFAPEWDENIEIN